MKKQMKTEEAIARAFNTGGYTMKEITVRFKVHYSTVSRAVKTIESLVVRLDPAISPCRLENCVCLLNYRSYAAK